MEIKVRRYHENYILDVAGELDLYNAYRLRDATVKLVERGVCRFVINLKAVRYIDSSGIGALLSINSLLAREGRELRIVNIPRQVQRVIDLTRLADFLPIAATELDGIESIGRSAAAVTDQGAARN